MEKTSSLKLRNWIEQFKKSFLWDEDDETNGGRVQPKSSLQSESKKQDIIHQNPHALLYIPGFSLKTQFCAIFWCEITDLKYAFRTFEKNVCAFRDILYVMQILSSPDLGNVTTFNGSKQRRRWIQVIRLLSSRLHADCFGICHGHVLHALKASFQEPTFSEIIWVAAVGVQNHDNTVLFGGEMREGCSSQWSYFLPILS